MPSSTDRTAYVTRALSPQTWPDFVKLFSQGGGWDHCGCMHFHRPQALPKSKWLHIRKDRGRRNLREKKALVDSGRSHGILVYADGRPVGWCQYGPREELPRVDRARHYRGLVPQEDGRPLWRITCFVVHKKHRRLGVAGAALEAALQAIRERGGGLVEAYPVARWSAGTFGNVSTHGAASMFEKRGFRVVAPYGPAGVLMRKEI